MSIVLKKSTTKNNCFTDSTCNRESIKKKLDKQSKSFSSLGRRILDINNNLESVCRIAGATAGAIKNKIFWKKRSVNLTEYDPVYKVVYLGNVLTPWAKGPDAIEKPLCILWKNYCINVKSQIIMKVRINKSSLNALTTQHGLTEYAWNRITFCETNNRFPKVLAWIYRHPSKKFKHELRCHAVLFSKEDEASTAKNHILTKLSIALSEFRREKRMQGNSRQFMIKAYKCHQLFCSQQIEPFNLHHFDHIDSSERHRVVDNADENDIADGKLTSSVSSVTDSCVSRSCSTLQNVSCDRLSDDVTCSGFFSVTQSQNSHERSCSTGEMSKCLISARSSTSSSSSRTSSTSSCSCSGESTCASLRHCKRSAKKNQSTCTLNYSGANCTGRLFSQYAGKSGASLIPVRKKHLVRGQANFRSSLERSKSAPRLTCIDEEDDEVNSIHSHSSSSSTASSHDSDEDDVENCDQVDAENHSEQIVQKCDESQSVGDFIDEKILSDLLLTVDVREDKDQTLILNQSLSSAPSSISPSNKTPCYQYILETV